MIASTPIPSAGSRWLQADPLCRHQQPQTGINLQILIYWDLWCSYAALPTGGIWQLHTDMRSVKPSVSPPGCHRQLIQIVCTDDVYQPVCFPLVPNWHLPFCLCVCVHVGSFFFFFTASHLLIDCGHHRRLFTGTSAEQTCQQGWITPLISDE